jgi:hypothetical protein
LEQECRRWKAHGVTSPLSNLPHSPPFIFKKLFVFREASFNSLGILL